MFEARGLLCITRDPYEFMIPSTAGPFDETPTYALPSDVTTLCQFRGGIRSTRFLIGDKTHPRALLKALAVRRQSRSACHSAVRCSPLAMLATSSSPCSSLAAISAAAAIAIARNCSLMCSVVAFTWRPEFESTPCPFRAGLPDVAY